MFANLRKISYFGIDKQMFARYNQEKETNVRNRCSDL